jgi:hypothetical protein
VSESDYTEDKDRKTDSLKDQEEALHQRAYDAHYKWLRHVVTLAAGALTLLVSFQNSYVHPGAHAIILLKICWGSLGISILFGILSLFGEAVKPHQAAVGLHRMRRTLGETGAARRITDNPVAETYWMFPIYDKMTVVFFIMAVGCGVSFALINLPQ